MCVDEEGRGGGGAGYGCEWWGWEGGGGGVVLGAWHPECLRCLSMLTDSDQRTQVGDGWERERERGEGRRRVGEGCGRRWWVCGRVRGVCVEDETNREKEQVQGGRTHER